MRFLSHSTIGALMMIAMAGLSGPALAHAHLQSADPAPSMATDTAPKLLRLTFSERLELAFTGLSLTGPGQDKVRTGPARLAPGDPDTLEVPLALPLAAGIYTVDWHALSADGHQTRGSYNFTVAP